MENKSEIHGMKAGKQAHGQLHSLRKGTNSKLFCCHVAQNLIQAEAVTDIFQNAQSKFRNDHDKLNGPPFLSAKKGVEAATKTSV